MRCCILLLATALVAGGSLSRADSESPKDLLWDAAFRAQDTGICNVHNVRMKRKLVPIHWKKKIPSDSYNSAMLVDFPNAQEDEDGGELMVPRLAHVKRWRYVCPECKRAAKKWALSHRSDPEAQWILSHEKA